MKHRNAAVMSVGELVKRFVEISVAQDQALLEDDTAEFNRLYDQKVAILKELKSRDGDQRRSLLPLYDHPNMQVRLNAAKATLAVDPITARRMLETISTSRRFPQAGDAGMCLWNLDRGVFKPE